MKIVRARNVCVALPLTMEYLKKNGRNEPSNGGEVIVAQEPMITETQLPRERVLFSAARDANPFFHLFEAIWMLAGENNGFMLDRFIKNFSGRYGEEDGLIHDAYGWRWRHAFGFDQLDAVVQRLLINPLERQCVIQMWDAMGYDDLQGKWKTRPCNTHVFLRLNNHALDITVCCRSNDMIWGCHGANAVHFSVLQEYIAARIDAEIGTMYQISNNAHIYLEQYPFMRAGESDKLVIHKFYDDRYDRVSPLAMFLEPGEIDQDIRMFMDNMEAGDLEFTEYRNPWFYNTLTKAIQAHGLFKQKQFTEALVRAEEIEASDWRVACYEWIERRVK
jgi:thymidylate synthase